MAHRTCCRPVEPLVVELAVARDVVLVPAPVKTLLRMETTESLVCWHFSCIPIQPIQHCAQLVHTTAVRMCCVLPHCAGRWCRASIEAAHKLLLLAPLQIQCSQRLIFGCSPVRTALAQA
jgi:hypothetical protein